MKKKYTDLTKNIKIKDQENNEIRSKNQRNEEILIKLTQSFLQYVCGWTIQKKVYDKIISDLRVFLPHINPENTEEFIKFIKNCYSKEISGAEKYFMDAKKDF